MFLANAWVAPLFAVWALELFDMPVTGEESPSFFVPTWGLITVTLSLCAFIALTVSTTPYHQPRFLPIVSFFGFFTALLWISVIANLLVNLLRSIGQIMKLSNAILGLTVLAVGNSVPDLFANLSVARMGLPNMAAAACFGGPMLNIVMGIGVSTLYHNLRYGTVGGYRVQVTPVLLASAINLTLALVLSLTFIPMSKWHGKASLGIYLISLYALSMIINVCLEVFV